MSQLSQEMFKCDELSDIDYFKEVIIKVIIETEQVES